jgi:hypothetical protein
VRARIRERTSVVASTLLVSLSVSLVSGAALAQPSNTAPDARHRAEKGQPVEAFGGYGGGARIPEPVLPSGVDVFNLTLEQTRRYSRSLNFEVVGHSYFKGPWLSPFAKQHGLGAGFNGVRVYDGIAYLGGYNGPPTLFGTLIADVHDPLNMKPLSFVPCKPGTRCVYVRVNQRRHILVGAHDSSKANPDQPSGPVQAGVSFTDVSDPAKPKELGYVVTEPNGATHGFDIDDRYAYVCATTPKSKKNPGKGFFQNHELVIIDYQDPTHPVQVGSFHVPGQEEGEAYGPTDAGKNPDGTPQMIWCHEVFYDKDKLYIAYRDAGMIILNVADRAHPVQVSRLDYVPPYSGQNFGAAHSSIPILPTPTSVPKLVINTDELFGCPPGFGRVMDISELSNPQVISTFRIPHVSDSYNFTTEQFECPPGGSLTSHLPWQSYKSASLFFITWYNEGLRAFDFSNPYEPREIGYYYSPPYVCGEFTKDCGGGVFTPVFRHSREEFEDPTTGLIYVTDGNGGGLTVLRWTGPIPPRPPLPGAR